MKKYLYMALCATMLLVSACDEDKYLEEIALDTKTAENSYSTASDFDAAIVELYYLTRYEFFSNGDRSIDYLYGTDMMMLGGGLQSNLGSDLDPTGAIASAHWERLYRLVAQSNVAITRLSSSVLTDDEKVKYEAKARFFRGFAYRTLAYLYGGVPLQLEEVTTPKTDFVRATYKETLAQAIADVKYAAENLDDIADVENGEISAPAAYHLLSELYLADDQYQKAIDAATVVITNPALGLMKTRFGARTSQPGDVYWDLFQRNNQNRSAGNTEGIWVIQFETDVNGGGATTNTYFWTTPGNYLLERHCAPQVGLFRFIMPDGTQQAPFTWPTGDYSGGRGIGSLYPDPHFYTEVWQSDFNNDIRNSNYNFVRKIKYNNSSFIAKYASTFGDSIDLMNPQLPAGVTLLTGLGNQATLPGRYLSGYQSKCTTPYDHPTALYLNASTYLLSGTAGGTYTDQYMFRLSETYLLRAEAYLKLGNKGNAALDINVVRNRAHASDVAPADVDIDYILDERLREFGIEEKRRLTLSRTGEFYNRVKKYNPFYNSAYTADGKDFQEKYTLYPIPQSAIEANKGAVITQNPGYE